MILTIVGGGTSGWMTAAAFAKTFPHWKITIVSDGDPIGVGESTTPHINQYLKYMGIDDSEFLTQARATYKSSSRFQDFLDVGKVFHYPNGQSINTTIDYNEWMYAKAYYPSDVPEFAEVFMPFVTIAECGKLALDHHLTNPYSLSVDRSFHIDASAFTEYLKRKFCQSVRHISSKVDHVNHNGDQIDSIIVDGETITSDFYIDCTGFASILNNNTEWIQYSGIPTDTALVTRTEYVDKNKEMVPYTNARGMSSGWQWTIPTWDYISRGYVFSSYHQSIDDAAYEFGWDNPRVVKFKNGRYSKAWVGNKISIGLSFGFIEPLESTSLFNTHHGILSLLDIFSEGRPINKFAKDRYNHNMCEHLDGWKEFVEAHYYYSNRNDTPFWRMVTEETEYDLKGAHADVMHLMVSGDPITALTPIVYILAGSGYTNVNKRLFDFYGERYLNANDIIKWRQKHSAIKSLAERMPTMYEYLKQTFEY